MGFIKQYETSVRPAETIIPNPFFEVVPMIHSLPTPTSGVADNHKSWKGGNPRLPLGHKDACINCGERGRILITMESKKHIKLCFPCKDKFISLFTTIGNLEDHEEEEY